MRGMGAGSANVLGAAMESWSKKLPSLKAAETREVNSSTSAVTHGLVGVLAIVGGRKKEWRKPLGKGI